jgi:hypothetical protein
LFISSLAVAILSFFVIEIFIGCSYRKSNLDRPDLYGIAWSSQTWLGIALIEHKVAANGFLRGKALETGQGSIGGLLHRRKYVAASHVVVTFCLVTSGIGAKRASRLVRTMVGLGGSADIEQVARGKLDL